MNNISINDQKVVKKIVKNSGSSFYWGMNILKSSRRRAMFAVYAFCRTVDDIADSELALKKKKNLLNDWVKKIENIYKGLTVDSLTRELDFSIKEYNLIKNDFLEIIDGMRIDSKKNIIYPPKRDLENYCDKVAGAVGCLSISIFGIKNKISGRSYAKYMGRALQLTNILRDIKEDSERGRCYIFREALEKNNIKMKPEHLLKSDKLYAVCEEISKVAENYYTLASSESNKINDKGLIAPEIMKNIYLKLFIKMKKNNWNFNQRIKLSILEKLLVVFSTVLRRRN
ncbi:squalene/phytoene synthase family protein [Alphaproteobacteria bacterium]|nr:squalene/phytoene synthase family protein [Alphaproteobacteria bacterium]